MAQRKLVFYYASILNLHPHLPHFERLGKGSTARGVNSLRHLWENVVRRPVVSAPES
jgi:hypothetical protein